MFVCSVDGLFKGSCDAKKDNGDEAMFFMLVFVIRIVFWMFVFNGLSSLC